MSTTLESECERLMHVSLLNLGRDKAVIAASEALIVAKRIASAWHETHARDVLKLALEYKEKEQ